MAKRAAGRLIVLDGLDGSGKSTQGELAAAALEASGELVRLISFPDYTKPSSALVRMYLGGEFGSDPADVNAYAAGSFYAVDRYASFKKFWEADYQAGKTILATRYTTSNAIYQMEKLPRQEWDGYLDWLAGYEYGLLGLPRPDLVVFLDMGREVADQLLLSRYGGDPDKQDIHEKNKSYLARCRETALYSADKLGWRVLRCDDGESPLPQETVTSAVLAAIRETLPLHKQK